jgi:hypothetical protein
MTTPEAEPSFRTTIPRSKTPIIEVHKLTSCKLTEEMWTFSNFHVFPCGSCGNSYSWKPCAPLKIKQPYRFSVLGAFKVQDEKGTWEIQKMGQQRGYFD